MTLLLKSDKTIGEPASLSLKSVQTDKYNTVFAGHKSIVNFIDLPNTVADGTNIDDVYILGKQSSVMGAQSNITANKGVSFVDNATDKSVLLPDAWDLSKYKVGDDIIMCFWVSVLSAGAGNRSIAGWKYSSTTNWYVYLTSALSIGVDIGTLQINNSATIVAGEKFLLSIHLKITATGFNVVAYKNKNQTNSGTKTGAIPVPTASSPRVGRADGTVTANNIMHRAFIRKFDAAKTNALAIASDEYDKFFSKL